MNEIYSRRNQAALHKRGHLLVGFLLAGYPSREGFLDALVQSVEAGLDIVEVGFPSRNPVNDGQVIKDANLMADFTVWDDIAYWRQIRAAVDVPVWVMGYREDFVNARRHIALARAGAADAVVLPELTGGERAALARELAPYGCDVIGFVNGETPLAEAEACFSDTPIIYLPLYVGQTGEKGKRDTFEPMLALARRLGNANLFAGFGIDTPQRVEYLLQKGFAGAIVGTAMVRHQNESLHALLDYIRVMKAAAGKEA